MNMHSLGEVMNMHSVWFKIARRIYNRNRSGPYICDISDYLLQRSLITEAQSEAVLKALRAERKRQGREFKSALWPDAYGLEKYIVRIRFCTKQIRRLIREARRRA